MPQEAAVDSRHMLYVRDIKRLDVAGTVSVEILVFGTDGKLVRTIGRRGQGPGEFMNISCLTIGRNGQIVLFDGGAQRIALLDSAGAYVGGYKLPRPGWKSVSFIHQEESGDVVLLDTYEKQGQQNIFEVYPADFKQLKSSFGPVSRFIDAGEKLYQLFAPSFRTSVVPGVGYVIAPWLYDGKIFLIDTRRDIAIREMTGRKPALKTIEYLSDNERNKLFRESSEARRAGRRFPSRMMSQYGQEGVVHIKYNNESRGIFFSGGRILHFVEMDTEKGTGSWIEVFSPQGAYLGSLDVTDRFSSAQGFAPLAFDPEGFFYYKINDPDGNALIKKARWELNVSAP